jgi:hypothetical protein
MGPAPRDRFPNAYSFSKPEGRRPSARLRKTRSPVCGPYRSVRQSAKVTNAFGHNHVVLTDGMRQRVSAIADGLMILTPSRRKSGLPTHFPHARSRFYASSEWGG